MMNMLLRMFVRDYEKTEDIQVRNAYGKLAGVVGILCNLILFGGKMLAGLLSGSMSVMADALNNLADASSSIVSFLGFKMAGKPADPEHPYGHARYEYLSGLLIALMVLLIGVELLKSGVEKTIHPTEVTFRWLSFWILIASVLVKLWMARLNRVLGKRISSQTLFAAAQDSRNDVVSTLAVLLAMVISHFFHWNLDGIMTVAVAIFILYSGVGLVRETLNPLLGRAPDPDTVRMIHEKIVSYPGVLGTHDLMIHDYGPGRQFASVHVEVAAETNVLESHDMIDNMERDFLAQYGIHMIAHLDPIVTADPAVSELHDWLAAAVRRIHPEMTIHDLRIVPGKTHTNVIFDCVVPSGCVKSHSEIRAEIQKMVCGQYPDHYCVITLDDSFAAMPHDIT